MADSASHGVVTPSAASMRSRNSITGRLDDLHDPAKLRRLSSVTTTARYTQPHVA
jgi:hypothetical protein